MKECGDRGGDLHRIGMPQEVVSVVRNHELLEGHVGLLQATDQVGGLAETDVAIVVAVDDED